MVRVRVKDKVKVSVRVGLWVRVMFFLSVQWRLDGQTSFQFTSEIQISK